MSDVIQNPDFEFSEEGFKTPEAFERAKRAAQELIRDWPIAEAQLIYDEESESVFFIHPTVSYAYHAPSGRMSAPLDTKIVEAKFQLTSQSEEQVTAAPPSPQAGA
jgi:hypothetical protein